jgi:hypothetical protein
MAATRDQGGAAGRRVGLAAGGATYFGYLTAAESYVRADGGGWPLCWAYPLCRSSEPSVESGHGWTSRDGRVEITKSLDRLPNDGRYSRAPMI